MRVKFSVLITGKGVYHRAGSIAEAPASELQPYVDGGYAELLDGDGSPEPAVVADPELEAAKVTAPETATRPRRSKRITPRTGKPSGS